MWDFLKTVLEQHGLASAVLIVVMGGSGLAIRSLYKQNQELSKEMGDVRVEEHVKRSKMREETNTEVANLREAYSSEMAGTREAYTSEIATMKESHYATLARLQEEWRREEQAWQKRLDDIQEKRVCETQEFVREATRHVAMTREEIGKISKTMEILTDVMTGRRPAR